MTMNGAASLVLPKAVPVKIRIDGAVVAVVSTHRIEARHAHFPVELLPLTANSFVELEFRDGTDRLIVPARVLHVGETEVTLVYEQTGAVFKRWLMRQHEQ